jgi:hypothetical protein
VIAIVLQALIALAPKALKTRGLMALAPLTLLASALGLNALPVLVGAGLVTLAVRKAARGRGHGPARAKRVGNAPARCLAPATS